MSKDPFYKVCILTAGIGSRVGDLSNTINKGVLPVHNKAVLSHIIDKFPKNVEIVIAIGHKKDTVIDYLALAYPERKFTFVEVEKYAGPGSGPGYSLLACKNYLQAPFIFSTSDTIVLEDIPLPEKNWIGVAPVQETEPYCTVKIVNELVSKLNNKIKTDDKLAFIGLAGIHDFDEFFSALEQDNDLHENEFQMTTGLNGLLEKQLSPVDFTWFDTGTLDKYNRARKHLSGESQKFDFSKSDEFLYFVNNRVIKFFADETISEKRCSRAEGSLKGLTPEIEEHRNNFYSYRMVPGQTVYNKLDSKIVTDFLLWAKTFLWKPYELSPQQKQEFSQNCHAFYYKKTSERLEKFYNKTGLGKDPATVNGVRIPSARDLLNRVDWDQIESGVPSNFHGDLQFDNILVPENAPSSGKNAFLLLDWRHEFGNSLVIGDLYYDLAKLYGGMILSYPLIKEGMFSCNVTDDAVYYDFFVKSDLIEARESYEKFLKQNDWDLQKVRTIAALIFLNMAPLHNAPFDMLLHSLSRNMLYKALDA